MSIEAFQHRLPCLDWKALEEGQQPYGWYLFTWIITICVLLAAISGIIFNDFVVLNYSRPIVASGLLVVAACNSHFRFCLLNLLQVVLFSSGFVVLTYIAARYTPTLADPWLATCDRAMGFSSLIQWHNMPLQLAYNSLLLQTAFTIIYFGLTDQKDTLTCLVARFMVAGMIVLGCFLMIPAIGPHIGPQQASYYRQFIDLRAGGGFFDFNNAEGLITFPSFHTTWALLLVAVWKRWWSVLLNAAVIVSTLTTGWHYLTDVLGGIVVCYMVCWLIPNLTPTVGSPEILASDRVILPSNQLSDEPNQHFLGAGEMSQEEKTKQIQKNERLRKLAHELEVQLTVVKQRLLEMELLLTDPSTYHEVLPKDK